MKRLAVFALLSALFTSMGSPARAEEIVVIGAHGVPARHVILGTVTKFEPYRLQVVRRNGNIQMIDLKNGTVILPTGTTPTPGERVAIVGYYSRGTFVANRVFVRS